MFASKVGLLHDTLRPPSASRMNEEVLERGKEGEAKRLLIFCLFCSYFCLLVCLILFSFVGGALQE